MRRKAGVALIVDESLSARTIAKALVTDALSGWDILVARNSDEALLEAAAVPSVDIAIIDRKVVGGAISLAEALLARYPTIHLGCVTDGEPGSANGMVLITKPLTEAKMHAFVAGLARRSA
jgi:hypothetical protein